MEEKALTEKTLPVVGAALSVRQLADHIDWLIQGQRDLELQDPIFTPMFDGDWSHLEMLQGYTNSFTLADWQTIARQAQDLLDGYTGRLSIHGPFMGMPLLTIDKKIRDVVRERLCQALEFAHEVGATQMVLHSPWEYFGGPFVPHSTENGRRLVIALVGDLLSAVLPVAEQAGCTLVIEGIFDKNTGPLLALIRALGSDYARLSIDTGHAHINYCLGGPPLDQWVRDGGNLLAHMHLQDGDGAADRHWAPGRGSINWYALFEALQEQESTPRLILETRDFRQGAVWLAEQGYVR
jgi:sugar phosphate isomerase/epimerase